MAKKEHILISILIILIIIFGMLIVSETLLNDDKANDTSIISREVISNSTDEPGTVEVIKNIGNPDGEKIAYVVGVHPLEYQTHETLLKL